MVTLGLVITVLILLGHLQTSPWNMTLTSAYLSTRIDILKNWGLFCIFLVTVVSWHFIAIYIPYGTVRLIKASLRSHFFNKSLLFNLARKVTLALTSDLFEVLTSPPLWDKNLTFQEKLLLLRETKLAESETTVQRNGLRGSVRPNWQNQRQLFRGMV
jgi:uncharacterized paraquat-inducible protein A